MALAHVSLVIMMMELLVHSVRLVTILAKNVKMEIVIWTAFPAQTLQFMED